MGLLQIMDQSFMPIAPLPCLFLQVELMIGLFCLVLLGVLFLNSVKNTVPVLHLLSAAVLLSLG